MQAQLFQTLWCASFRPKYNGNWVFLSSGFLAATALSLSKAHSIFIKHGEIFSTGQYLTFFLPLALHYGWVTAASLVNLNGAVSMIKNVSDKVVAYTGHLSVIIASALGASVSYRLGAPVFGGVISWALASVADSMKQRIAEFKKNDEKTTSVNDLDMTEMQRKLSLIGSITSGAVSALTVASLAFPSKNMKNIPTP